MHPPAAREREPSQSAPPTADPAARDQEPPGLRVLPLSNPRALLWAIVAIISFHLAYYAPALSILMVLYLFALTQLTRVRTGWAAFLFGIVTGLLTVAPKLDCFWTIFGPRAIGLWLVLGFWISMFVVLGRLAFGRFGPIGATLSIPFLWTGLEYFRSELYYLRFSWLNTGYGLTGSVLASGLHTLGVYGAGFLAAVLAVALWWLRARRMLFTSMTVAIAVAWICWPRSSTLAAKGPILPGTTVRVAGVQLEFPSEPMVEAALDRLVQECPHAEILMLSEYTFDGPVPETIKAWCRDHRRYLVVGGKEAAQGTNYHNTAYVIGPGGEIAFRQAKSVPIQFFSDGMPAAKQEIWNSPWGRIGLCICYDLSYTRVTDRLIRLGAQAMLVPTMDEVDWGKRQHELHARVAPARATEYGIPIFRLASSGISQIVNQDGEVTASAEFPGQGAPICGRLTLATPGTLPVDRWLAPFSTAVAALLAVAVVLPIGRKFRGADGEETRSQKTLPDRRTGQNAG